MSTITIYHTTVAGEDSSCWWWCPFRETFRFHWQVMLIQLLALRMWQDKHNWEWMGARVTYQIRLPFDFWSEQNSWNEFRFFLRWREEVDTLDFQRTKSRAFSAILGGSKQWFLFFLNAFIYNGWNVNNFCTYQRARGIIIRFFHIAS